MRRTAAASAGGFAGNLFAPCESAAGRFAVFPEGQHFVVFAPGRGRFTSKGDRMYTTLHTRARRAEEARPGPHDCDRGAARARLRRLRRPGVRGDAGYVVRAADI